MSYEKVAKANQTIIGIKQTLKTIRAGKAVEIVIAHDADANLLLPILEEANKRQLPVTYVESKKALGEAAGIQVAASIVTLIE
ncbi:ribosomal L7Ae/L30e/S12e/Gadd45 family protein [Savagea sp. SN6]|uniref:Ribosomal L7Ae/L30e/S12e/Gadd45 family protein n=1 Tax=Savagea serpentis TaxID=2785297 RepID=A0A8J7G3Y0_9BACL|nr:ribosomal L7Ae/L30e/S12e/Gadd45 family protein [Savagea serpentis]MBF4500957.1 ribosomal L7Ae/L30e/S12e/Gadd45 family protein [Savagea serpentis]